MLQDMTERIREVYDGPLVIANDLMRWNISKDSIQQREVIAAERVQPPPTSEGYMKARRSGEAKMPDFIMRGKWKDIEMVGHSTAEIPPALSGSPADDAPV